ncbi:MAG TPA: hypothetical protein VME23_00470 [Terracidiphilus sp.]|nr:hypothetical protein [Terracidiphilus sp.]
METRTHCAYNQTRECFLGLEITIADLSYAGIVDLMSTVSLKSGEGLWIVPYRDIPAAGLQAPLDLIYLDEDCRVIDLVESFPTFRVSSSSPKAASVLALPVHSIYSSQTQTGDQLVLCIAEEMERRLERIAGMRSDNDAVPAPAGNLNDREKPVWATESTLFEPEKRGDKDSRLPKRVAEPLRPTGSPYPPKSWLERWLSPDPRRAPREQFEGLTAFYWTGATPQAHAIRDISATGIYIITEDRWYPGTLVLMTLTMNGGGDKTEERSIVIQSRAVRWGSDGVGLKFVLPDARAFRHGHNILTDGVDRRELDRFLNALRRLK